MQVTRVAAALALAFGLLDVVTPTVILTTSTATLAALANGAVAVGAVVLGASLLKSLVRRGKRQAPECLAISDPNMLFDLAISADNLGCSQRFVCEVAARDISTLTEEEKIIRSVFTSEVVAEGQETAGKALLAKAAALGVSDGAAACADAFNKCPFDNKTLLQEFLKATGN